jgi:hypothetical protein
MRLCALFTLYVLVPTLALAAALEGPRVRALDTRVQFAIAEGTARSASFRKLLTKIDKSDVIVYVEFQPHLKGRLVGTTTWVTTTQQYRYLRVALNPELTGWRLVAALAHELQHVVEVGEARSIVDSKSLSAHYRETGVEKVLRSEEWETQAAQVMGETVRRELAASAVGGESGSGMRAEPRALTREQ